MPLLHHPVDEALRVTAAVVVSGRLGRDAIVARGGNFALRGICDGDVIIEAGGIAELWGIIRGSVVNQGGRVTIGGVIKGDLDASRGDTCLVPTSVVHGHVRCAERP